MAEADCELVYSEEIEGCEGAEDVQGEVVVVEEEKSQVQPSPTALRSLPRTLLMDSYELDDMDVDKSPDGSSLERGKGNAPSSQPDAVRAEIEELEKEVKKLRRENGSLKRELRTSWQRVMRLERQNEASKLKEEIANRTQKLEYTKLLAEVMDATKAKEKYEKELLAARNRIEELKSTKKASGSPSSTGAFRK